MKPGHWKWHQSIDRIRLPTNAQSIVTMALSRNVFEIFDVKEYNDLEIRVRGHSRSPKVTFFVPFKVNSGSSKVIDLGTNRNRVCNFLLVFNSNLGPILHRFGDTAAYRSKNRKKISSLYPPQSHKSPSLGVTACEFFDESYLARKWNDGLGPFIFHSYFV